MTVKTNAMRILDRAKISYTLREYPLDGLVAAVNVPEYLGIPEDRLFKTLVTTDTNHGYYVFCLPSSCELDLKKAAVTAGVKRVEMLKQKDLQKLTGYIHDGCFPVGMKKLFPTVIDTHALDWDTVVMSAGKVGMLMQLDPRALESLIGARFDAITKV